MKVKVAAIQMSADIGGREANVERAERLLIQAARQGADLCVLPELALDEFFPLYKDTRYFAYAEELDGPTVRRFRSLAGELGIYLALPLFEKSLIGTYYNSLVLLTPEGTIGAVYRKVHVPCTRSYERYYFTPGPEFVVADEPVAALDVSIQAQVLNLMKEIQKDLNLTYLFIAHDLSVVQYMSDRIMVMYLGKIVEVADSRALYEEPLHPYTKALLSAIPIADIHTKKQRQILEGEVPSPIHKPSGCAFRNRCPHCMEICKTEDPALRYHGKEGHMVACHLYDGKESGDEA